MVTKEKIKIIGKKVRELRHEKGYTQERAANEAGMSPYYLRRIEYGNANPTIGVLYKLAQVYDVDISVLVMEDACKNGEQVHNNKRDHSKS